MNTEPLKYFIEKYGIDVDSIKRIVYGKKYSALMLNNGNIGVCSNLLRNVNVSKNELLNIDINNLDHRIIANAYFCALFNNDNIYNKKQDIYKTVDFSIYKDIVMIGLFRPLVKKFERDDVNIHIFDKMIDSDKTVPMKFQKDYLSKADCVILSGTTVFNGSFQQIINNTNEKCDVFLLGPSCIMHQYLFKFKNLKVIFGSVFNKYDDEVLNIIEKDYGTKEFLPLGNKVEYYPEN
ncbi:MAG: hypothetical protein J7J86_04575 [Bacteroidales bacterium]|nr:hypothetical protein [Bacteroidales bacterium]